MPSKPFQLIFTYARKYSLALTITALSMLALVGVQLLIPWIVKTLIATITDPGTMLADMDLVTRLTLIVLAVYLARAGLQFLRSYLAHSPVGAWSPTCASTSTTTCSASPCASTRTSRPAR